MWILLRDRLLSYLQHFEGALDTNLRNRRDFLKFDKDQTSYTISQGGLRLLLAAYLDVDVSEVTLGRRPKGKPFLENDTNLYFNITNSGEVCALAFCRKHEVGIDVEEVRPLPDLPEMVEKNCTSREAADIWRSRDPLRQFYRYWTLKEAYLKAIGEGMRLTPENMEFSISRDQAKLLSVNGLFDGTDWRFRFFDTGADAIGTLAYPAEAKLTGRFMVG